MTAERPVLVTGAAGFAGSHLIDSLAAGGAPIAAWHRPAGRRPHLQAAPEARGPSSSSGAGLIIWEAVDLLDAAAVQHAVARLRPAIVYHCAGVAQVGGSWRQTDATLAGNVLATHHLLAALGREAPGARVLIPSSGLIYRPTDEPAAEDHPTGPASPYALSKLAQERLGLRALAEDGCAVYVARAFNHTGPRQSASFAASSFARQIARIEAGQAEPIISVGNLDARREATDVRDTVRAYRAIVERGRPGRIYNVCSGHAWPIRDLLETLLRLAHVRVDVRVDPFRLRPIDHPVLVGDPRRIQTELDWCPAIPLETTLGDLLNDWRSRV